MSDVVTVSDVTLFHLFNIFDVTLSGVDAMTDVKMSDATMSDAVSV